MTVYVWETPESRKRHASNDNTNTGTLQYFCHGTTDDQIAGDAILLQANADWPLGFRLMLPKTVDLTPLGRDMWLGDVQYVEPKNPKERDPPDTDEWRITFTPGDGTAKVKFAKAGKTTKFPSDAPDFKGAIGIDKSDGKIKVNGVERPIPGGSKLTIHYRKTKASITTSYVDTLDSMRGTRNNATFYDFAAKRLMFLGATGTDSSLGDPEVDFDFLIDIDEVGLEIGDITGINKPPTTISTWFGSTKRTARPTS